ncbi:isoprenyl transferase [Microbacter margulisiae]|uniref:Isoprenyl transferase n=1 Tax=Microbacter margulisiae TaxID=1350067 RepID=A0A7W5H1T6_9PORP|nr:isoprenyl transferase [Microbacter margulisiae]MBB3186707.1 undecaprenyl diphosphate synthase [Microbacter margulisiae]
MENSTLYQIDKTRLPHHVAVIMDGNGRWATQKGFSRIYGHQQASISVRDVVEIASELGIQYLTLYTFSTENWGRPSSEVDALMELLATLIEQETPALHKNNVRLLMIGDKTRLSETVWKKLDESMSLTANNQGLTLVLALNYSARWEIVSATKQLCQEALAGSLSPDLINDKVFSNHLTTKNIPDPDLLIRTSGELRISNFLLWQLAYTELYFTKTLWPDFRKEDFCKAIYDYQNRERRFGKTGEQLKNQ